MSKWIFDIREIRGEGKEGNGGALVKEAGDVLLAEPKTKPKRPPLYKVILLNDDYTPMDFVVFILKEVFRKDHEEAVRIMLEVHHQGSGVCGLYTRDVAETKAEEVIHTAKQNSHPLQCVLEKE